MLRLLAAVAASVLAASPLAAQPPSDRRASTVTVAGEARLEAPPDLVEIALGVVSEAPRAASASAQNAARMEKIIPALRSAAGPGGDVQTISYAVAPVHREGPRGPGGIERYRATHVVRVRSRQVAAAGKVLDRGLELGANTVERVTFTLSDEHPARAEALRLAAARAQARAQTLAQALGLRVLRVIEAAEAEPFVGISALEAHAVRAETPIEAGAIEVRARVTLVAEVARPAEPGR